MNLGHLSTLIHIITSLVKVIITDTVTVAFAVTVTLNLEIGSYSHF